MQHVKSFFRKNSIWFGIGLGAIVPVLFYFPISLLVEKLSLQFTFGISMISEMNIQLISVFLNLFIFRKYLVHKDFEMTGRGVMIASMVYVLIHFAIRWGLMNQ